MWILARATPTLIPRGGAGVAGASRYAPTPPGCFGTGYGDSKMLVPVQCVMSSGGEDLVVYPTQANSRHPDTH